MAKQRGGGKRPENGHIRDEELDTDWRHSNDTRARVLNRCEESEASKGQEARRTTNDDHTAKAKKRFGKQRDHQATA